MTQTRFEPMTSSLKSNELTNSTTKHLCIYCSFKIHMVAHSKLIRLHFHDLYTATEERYGATCHRRHLYKSVPGLAGHGLAVGGLEG